MVSPAVVRCYVIRTLCLLVPQLTHGMFPAIQFGCGCHKRASFSYMIEVVDGILMVLTLVGVEGDRGEVRMMRGYRR
jgi:hypothetical protein